MLAQTKLIGFDYLSNEVDSMTQQEAVQAWSDTLVSSLAEINRLLEKTLHYKMNPVSFAFIQGT